MKIFDSENGWQTKVNFVDVNNVFVGFDTTQDCCENADWFIKSTIWESGEDLDAETPSVEELESYVFDKTFHEDVTDDYAFDAGSMIVFKLVAEDKPDLYLHLYNCHNGYYGHGFEFGIVDGEIIESGCI